MDNKTDATEEVAKPAPASTSFQRIALAIILVGLGGVFALDLIRPNTLTFGMLYVALVLAALLLGRIRWVVAITLIASALAIGGLWLAISWNQEALSSYQLGNRVLSLLLIAVTGLLGAGLLAQVRQKASANQTVIDTRRRLENSREMLEMATRLTGVGGWTVRLESGRAEWTREVCRIHEVA